MVHTPGRLLCDLACSQAVHHGDTVLGYAELALTLDAAVEFKDSTMLYAIVEYKIKGVYK